MAVDQEYMYKVLRGFGEGGLPQHTINALVILGFILASIAAIVFWYNNKKLKERLDTPPAGWIKNKTLLNKIFETALVYRSKIDLSFQARSQKRITIPCTLTDAGDELVLEVAARDGIGSSWIGREVTGFFHIPTKPAGSVIFYNFNTTITDVIHKGSQYINIHLNLPEHVEQTQKREFLRVSPPSRYYDYINIIPDSKQGMLAGFKFLKSKGEHTPGLIGGKDSTIVLSDISGGGLSAEITRMTTKRAAKLNLNKGQNFLVLLSLVDTGNRGIIRYLFVTKIRRIFIDPTQGRTQLGLSFEAQFKGFDEKTKKPKWIRFTKGGCPEIDDWSYNLYLDLYREGNE